MSSVFDKLSTHDKIVRSKMSLRHKHPFFSYLVLYLKDKEVDKKSKIETAAVDNQGTLYYNPEFINGLKESELVGLLCHEVWHLAFRHISRTGLRDRQKWNIAIDLVTNQMLIDNGFDIPENGLIPNDKGTFIFTDEKTKKVICKITNIKEKTPEQIYDELPEEFCNQKIHIKFLDQHIPDGEGPEQDKDSGNGNSQQSGNDNSTNINNNVEISDIDWNQVALEAAIHAQQRGSAPAGLDRFLQELAPPPIRWDILLRKYIKEYIPKDYNWLKRNKKSYPMNTYLPSVTKTGIEVVFGIDLSGSIGQREMSMFLGTIIDIADMYRGAIDMWVYTHDVNVHSQYKVTMASKEKILNLKLKGGGGTSHKPIFNKIKKDVPQARVVIFLTDGYSDIENIEFTNYKYDKIFVITPNGTDSFAGKGLPKTKIVKIDKHAQ